MKLVLRSAVLGVLGLVVLLGLLTAWAVTTQTGTRALLTHVVLPRLGIRVPAENIQGRLMGPLALSDLTLELTAGRADVARVQLRWQPIQLLRGVLHVDRLRIDGARVELPDPPAADDEEPFALNLPVDVRIVRLEVSDSVLLSGDEPLIADLFAAASVEAHHETVSITGLDARADGGTVEGDVKVSTAADGEWDVDLRWHWAVSALGHEEVGGHILVDGVLADLAFAAKVDGVANGAVSGRVRELPHGMSWHADIVLEPLARRPELWPATLEGASGGLTSRGSDDDLSLQGVFSLPELDAEAVAVEARLAWPRDALEVETVIAVRARDLPEAELTVRGHWSDSVLTLERLRLASEEAGLVLAGNAVARITAVGIDYTFVVDGSLRQAQWPELRLHATGRGDSEAVRLQRLQAEALDAEILGSGTLAWADGLHADLAWDTRDIDPGVIWPDWPGRLDGAMHVQGRLYPQPDLSVTVAQLRGRLRDRELRADLNAQLQEDVLTVRHTEVRVGETTVTADGRVTPRRSDLAVMLESRDLQDLHPEASGALFASVVVAGATDAPVVSLQLRGEDMSWEGYALESIAADMRLDLSHPQADSRLALELSDLHGVEPLIDRLTLMAAGTRAEHHLELAGARDAARLSLILQGGVNSHLQWNGQLEDLLLAVDGDSLWRLQAPAHVSAGRERMRLADACLDGGTLGDTCIAGQWHAADGWQTKVSLEELDLQSFGRWLGADFIARGNVIGQIAARGNAQRFEHLSGDIELSAGTLAPRLFPDEPLVVWNRSTITLFGDSSQAAAKAVVDLAEHGGIEGRLRIGWNDQDPALDGRLAAELTQAELVTVFVPELARLEGLIGAAVELSGTLGQPSLRGELYWRNGAASMPTFGARAHDIELHGTVSNEEGFEFTATARAGDGELRSEGRFTLPPEPLSGEVRVSGSDALVVDLPGTQVLASPQLTLSYSEDRLVFAGDVRVPYGRITALPDSEAPEQVGQLSPDEVIVGAEAAEIEAAESPALSVDIGVLIGPDFRVDAEGLEAELEGAVQLVQLPGTEFMGRGEVHILDGSFTLFEQPLLIGEGRLFFSDSPLENPALDIRAQLTAEDVTVGAMIRGSLIEPEVTLFSEPPMPEAEVLSYMITGRGLHDLRIGEADIVHSAANSVMMAGSELLARQVATRLGFDAVGATGGAEPGSADLVIGLHLGSRLFVSYGVGLYEAISAMRLRYRLGRRWALEVISGDVSSADLMGTVER